MPGDLLDRPQPVRSGEELDAQKLEAFLKARLPELSGPIFVEQFPKRIQIIFGGAPKRKLLWLKSLSLETMTKPKFFAYSHTSESSAEAKPI